MTSNNTVVSVIIPLYNGGKFIEEAISSIMNQSGANIEIVVVDDGSTDGGKELVSKFDNIRLIKNKDNMGVSYSRNIGVRESKGKYITFLDADDLWVKDKTEFQIKVLSLHNELEGVYGRFKNFFDNKEEIPSFVDPDLFLKHQNEKMKSLGTLMVRRSVFEKVGYFSENLIYGEDIDWFVRSEDYGVKFRFYDKLLMHRRLHGKNLSYNSVVDKKDLLYIFNQSIKRKRELNE